MRSRRPPRGGPPIGDEVNVADAKAMARAATNFLDSLDDEARGKATFNFDWYNAIPSTLSNPW